MAEILNVTKLWHDFVIPFLYPRLIAFSTQGQVFTMSTTPYFLPLNSRPITPITLFRHPDQPQKRPASQNKMMNVNRSASVKPRCLLSENSDRIAIFNEHTGSYNVCSSTEAISPVALTREEAEAWIEGRLLLLKEKMSGAHFFQLVVMIALSCGCSMMGIWGIFKLLF